MLENQPLIQPSPMSDRLEQLTKMHKADPLDPFCTYGIALEHGKAGEVEHAIEWLNKTLELDKHYHYAFFQKAKMFSELGDDHAASAVLREGITIASTTDDEKACREMQELLESLG